MALARKSWSLNTFSASTWTDFVVGTAGGDTVRSILVSNTGGSTADIQFRVTDVNGVEQAIVAIITAQAANSSTKVNIDVLNLLDGQKLQIFSTTTSPDFYASGVSY